MKKNRPGKERIETNARRQVKMSAGENETTPTTRKPQVQTELLIGRSNDGAVTVDVHLFTSCGFFYRVLPGFLLIKSSRVTFQVLL